METQSFFFLVFSVFYFLCIFLFLLTQSYGFYFEVYFIQCNITFFHHTVFYTQLLFRYTLQAFTACIQVSRKQCARHLHPFKVVRRGQGASILQADILLHTYTVRQTKQHTREKQEEPRPQVPWREFSRHTSGTNLQPRLCRVAPQALLPVDFGAPNI